MAVNFQRLKAGQPWRVSQATADAILGAAEQYAAHDRDPDAVPPPTYEFAGDIITVRNDSGARPARFSVLGLDAALITDAQNLIEFQNYPRFSVVTPVWPDHVGTFSCSWNRSPPAAWARPWSPASCPCRSSPWAQNIPVRRHPRRRDGLPRRTQLGGGAGPWYGSGSGSVWALVRLQDPETRSFASSSARTCTPARRRRPTCWA